MIVAAVRVARFAMKGWLVVATGWLMGISVRLTGRTGRLVVEPTGRLAKPTPAATNVGEHPKRMESAVTLRGRRRVAACDAWDIADCGRHERTGRGGAYASLR